MQLILAFLKESGYHKTAEKIQSATGIECWYFYNINNWMNGIECLFFIFLGENSLVGRNALQKILHMSVKDISSALDPSLTQIGNFFLIFFMKIFLILLFF